MKAPKCPKCGKAHYSTQRCSAKETTPPAPLSPAVHGGDEAPPGGYDGDGESHERAYRVKSPLDPETSAGVAPGPLTAAEKQKAYRERHKDRVREADRLRKRMKRR